MSIFVIIYCCGFVFLTEIVLFMFHALCVCGVDIVDMAVGAIFSSYQ